MVNLRKHEPYDEMSFCDWNIKCKTTVLIKENEKPSTQATLVIISFTLYPAYISSVVIENNDDWCCGKG